MPQRALCREAVGRDSSGVVLRVTALAPWPGLCLAARGSIRSHEGAAMTTFLGLVIVAAVATAGDYLWYTLGVRHNITNGVIHGAVLLTAVGGVLGATSGHLLKGLPIGTLAGVGGALAYYAIIAAFGGRTYGTAIPAAWVMLWLLLAIFDGRWLRAPARPWREIALRGALAALVGGIAFALVMTRLWGAPPAGGRNYLVQFVAWAVAWAPGLIILTIDRPSGGAARP
jgi:hypothetical protein